MVARLGCPNDGDFNSVVVNFNKDFNGMILRFRLITSLFKMQGQVSNIYFDFFSCNSIFYCLVRKGYNQRQVSELLSISIPKLKNLISSSLSDHSRPLFSFVKRMAFSIENIQPSKCCKLFNFCIEHPDFKLNESHLEYILFTKNSQFDQIALFKFFEDTPYLKQIIRNYDKICQLLKIEDSNIFDVSDQNINSNLLQFRNNIRSITTLPNCLKSLNNRQRYFVNMALSLAYIGAKVNIDRGGHSSPHLKGEFIAQVRQNGTGILSTDRNIVRDVSDEEFQTIKNWFAENNILYVRNPIELDLDQFVEAQAQSTVICSVVDRRAPQDVIANIILPEGLVASRKSIDLKHEVMVKKRSNINDSIWMPLESALPLMFPVLFPYGTVPLIPGSTLRKKAQNLLLACDSVRCTGVGCQLILFLFDCITRAEYMFSAYLRQRLIFPNDGDRSFVPVPKAEDPSFALYWQQKEAEIQAMSFHFGYPDAMLTLTFNNKWDDVIEKSKSLGKDLFQNGNPLDPCYIPFDTMRIWDSHYKKLAAKKFRPICEYLGLGKVVHFVSRLEFQLRGAPHALVLLWLETPLSIKQIDEILSAHIPNEIFSPSLNQFVKGAVCVVEY